jgi:perosamine synthetase
MSRKGDFSMTKLAIHGGQKAVTLPGPIWPSLSDEDVEAGKAAVEAARTDPAYLCAAGGGGPMAEFESRFLEYQGARYGFALGAGGHALHVACMVVAEPGDEILCSPYSWGQTAAAILEANAIPVYVDVDPDTLTMDPTKIEEKITDQTRALMVVHIYGNPADMPAIMDIAQKHSLYVIEDCAQANGATINGQRVGTFGHFGCYSWGSGKNMSAGEGGFLVASSQELYLQAAMCGLHPARHRRMVEGTPHEPYADSLIYTYRPHPIACAIAQSQLKRLDQMNAWRRANADHFSEGISDLPGLKPPHVREGAQHVYHMYCATYVAEELGGLPRHRFIEALSAEGLGAGVYVGTPIHLRPRHQEHKFFFGKGCPWDCPHAVRKYQYNVGDCPVAEHRADVDLIIGSFGGMVEDYRPLVDQYITAVRKVVEHADEL